MNKEQLISTLRQQLTIAKEHRSRSKTDPQFAQNITALKSYQAQRLRKTHADLLASPDTREASEFFLNKLYGAQDFSQRDNDIERMLPTMEKLFPTNALEVITNAIILDALTESLDTQMANQLGSQFTEEQYNAAFINTSQSDRQYQLKLVENVGSTLCMLVNVPLLGTTIKMMRGPAKLANLIQMHEFLENGFMVFKNTKNPRAFVSTLISRERKLMEDMYISHQ